MALSPEESAALLAKNRRLDSALKRLPNGLATVEEIEELERRCPGWSALWSEGPLNEPPRPGFRARRTHAHFHDPWLVAGSTAELEILIKQFEAENPHLW